VTKDDELHLSEGGISQSAIDYASLVREASNGDRRAVEQLLMRAQEVAYRFSLLVCGHVDDAEDVMQDALLKTYRHVSRIRNPDAFRSWLYRTVKNACLMKRRRRVDEPARLISLDDDPDGPDVGPTVHLRDRSKTPDEIAMNNWLGRRLRRALKALPPGYRMVVFLREIEGLSTREVATITRLSEANVKTRLHRARLLLREQLEGA
jgi:RNA polymerase sigma-70 factor, ECF subfamily